MTIEDAVEFTDRCREFAELWGESHSISYTILDLANRRLALLQESLGECKESAKDIRTDLRYLDSGQATTDDGLQAIRDLISRREGLLEKWQEIISIDDETIDLYKRKLEIGKRMLCIYEEYGEYYPRAIAKNRADIVDFTARLKEARSRRKATKVELRKARRSHDVETVKECNSKLEYCSIDIEHAKERIPISKSIVRNFSKSIERNEKSKARTLAKINDLDRMIADAEEMKGVDEKQMADTAARIEELKAKYAV